MNPSMNKYALFALGLATLWVSGCATTGEQSARGVEQFDPVPPIAAGSETLEAVAPRSVTDLLRDADMAFQAANAAQEAGDEEAALRQYVLMLELLTEADLDPKIFYSLRDEFGSILNQSTQQASLYQPRQYSPLESNEYSTDDLRNFSIPFPIPEQVLAEIDRIQNSYPKNFQTFLDRSHKYLPYIQQQFREAGLPEELSYLALVESGFQPKIVSRAGAGGMWQFMRPTARRFDLRVDSYVDERYDWMSSTRAAIEYLTVLNKEFAGSWPLALTAYNMGEGGLARAIASNGGERDLFRLIETPPASYRIRLETKRYFPKFIATLIVARSPEKYGFKSNPQPPQQLVHMPVSGIYALNDLDKSLGYPEGTLAQLNPALLNETTPPSGSFRLLVPAQDRTRFASALRNTPKLKYAGGTHKVKRGETVSQIAARYGVSATQLMSLNGVRSARSLRAGQTLKLPGYHTTAKGGAPSSTATAATGSAPASTPSRGAAPTYTVKSGDTLYDIAMAHRVSVNDLQKWNNKGRRSRLRVGEKLYVGEASTTVASGTVRATGHHTVRAGEYPAKIARDYGIPVKDFLAWNNLGSQSTIKVGDTLIVSAATGNTPAPAPESAPAEPAAASERSSAPASPPKMHTVRKGESASVIASKYGIKTRDFLAWNGLTSRSILRVGKSYAVSPGQGDTVAASSEGEKELTHTVARGQNPTTIARRYGVKISDLFKWNKWPKNHVLQPGDRVIVRKG
jgi:membrane-bound lytic murein transglycosylase D